MKHTWILFGAAACSLFTAINPAFAQGTAFTYQGRLNANGSPADGIYDFRFRLAVDPLANNYVGSSYLTNGLFVTNGLFTATMDFGPGILTGSNYWLEVDVRTNGASSYTSLTPLQQLTPTPYAIFAGAAENVTGTIANANLPANPVVSGTVSATAFSGNGLSLSNVNAATLNGLTSTNFWKLGGNAGANPTNGAFLGTTDNLPFELKVNGSRAMRLEDALDASTNHNPNVILGFPQNVVSNGSYGCFIGGGGSTNFPNRVGGNFGSVVGGEDNIAYGTHSVAAGYASVASGESSVAMGNSRASGTYSAALCATTAAGDFSFAANLGEAYGVASTSLGLNSFAEGVASFSGGTIAGANFNGSFVWADNSTEINSFQDTSSNQFLIRATGGVGIGTTFPPPGGLNVASGGLGVSGQSSPYYYGAQGVFIENAGTHGVVYAFNYSANTNMPLCLNSPGGNVGVNTTTPGYPLEVIGTCAAGLLLSLSDRNAKENFQPVSAADILDKVLALPLSRWNFKSDKTSEHLGPMAQDFYAAFKVGVDDKHIATVDEEGVALAAIQGLNQKLNEKDSEIQQLEQRLEKLEKMVQTQAGK